jgi:hypothetical protein
MKRLLPEDFMDCVALVATIAMCVGLGSLVYVFVGDAVHHRNVELLRMDHCCLEEDGNSCRVSECPHVHDNR